jgi:hypothetical protein
MTLPLSLMIFPTVPYLSLPIIPSYSFDVHKPNDFSAESAIQTHDGVLMREILQSRNKFTLSRVSIVSKESKEFLILVASL